MIFWRRYVARTYTRTGNILWDRMFPVRFGNAKNIKIGLEIYPMGVYNTNEKAREKEVKQMEEEKECCCCHKTKQRSDKEYKDLLNRLSRIEGQIRGIRGMVEKDAYCIDILTQVAAANAALNSFNKVLLANHIKTCVTQDILDGKEETVDELVATLQKLMK